MNRLTAKTVQIIDRCMDTRLSVLRDIHDKGCAFGASGVFYTNIAAEMGAIGAARAEICQAFESQFMPVLPHVRGNPTIKIPKGWRELADEETNGCQDKWWDFELQHWSGRSAAQLAGRPYNPKTMACRIKRIKS